jgi:SAM-dependent methyltransferase
MPEPLPLDPTGLSEHAACNRESWNNDSDAYQSDHVQPVDSSTGPVWGIWQTPESELQVLGDVRGRDVLDLGCGAAQWSMALAKLGAAVVGLDLSERQLEHARRYMQDKGLDFPLVHASAESIPLPDDSFDIVVSDYGAMTFADPYCTIPEVARVLRPGGILVFCGSTPLIEMCYPDEGDHPGDRLEDDYFGMWALPSDGYVEYMLPYGAWIRLFRAHGFAVEDLVELLPKADAVSSFRDDVDRDWYRRWPGEQIWKVRKEG